MKKIEISDEILLNIINDYTKEAGVRELGRILRKVIRNYCIDKTKNKKLDINYIKNILGDIKYPKEEIDNHKGVVNSLAWTPYGGNIQKIECISLPGIGLIKMTGNVEKILKESIEVAISFIKLKKYTIKDFNKLDLHINALNAGIKKEGASGGLAMTTAIVSFLKNNTIDTSIAMTGEITLNGDVLAVGGIKEKIIGAYNNNIKTIFIPFNNTKDLNNIPNNIKNNINIVPVKNYEEIYDILFK